MLRTIVTILWKDLRIELRTRDALSASFVFCVLVLVIFNFTLDLNTEEARRLGGGFLWVSFAFGGILSLNRSFALEKADGCSKSLMLAPADRGAIYLGKFLANVIFMLVTQVLILPLFAMFFNVPILPAIPLLVLIFLLGSIGFSSVGTLFSAMAANTRMRELLLPLLLLPVSIPVLLAAVKTTQYALGVNEDASDWFKLLIVYDVVFVTASYLGFEYAMEE
ncbi:MAG: heme exporter protein CcmB [Hyphomicrobiaceae bacterium]|nr:heme exporter protein CcmB [Hyphomicrobiaceae bacterium]